MVSTNYGSYGVKISLYVDGVLDSEDFNNYGPFFLGDSIFIGYHPDFGEDFTDTLMI